MPTFYIRGARQPIDDETRTGVNFVDVLFAIVVGKILDLSVREGGIPIAGRSHLVLAAIVTITSWVGYHNSLNKGRYFLRPFLNLPFWQFVIDIALVYAYFLLAVTAERPAAPGHVFHADARPEAVLTAVIMVLYVTWDLISLRMRRSPLYPRRPLHRDSEPRRLVSLAGAATATLIGGVVVVRHPSSTVVVVTIDGLLLTLTVLYRLAKEWVTPPPSPTP